MIPSASLVFCSVTIAVIAVSDSFGRFGGLPSPRRRPTTNVVGGSAAAAASTTVLGSIQHNHSSDLVVSLTSPHDDTRTAADILHELADRCSRHDISLDVYGDFDQHQHHQQDEDDGEKGTGTQQPVGGRATSFLRRFEREVVEAVTAGTNDTNSKSPIEDAVFMPSGGMAQAIALLVHHQQQHQEEEEEEEEEVQWEPAPPSSTSAGRFACHETCHLLLHEQDAYRELLGMDAVVISTKERRGTDQNTGVSIPATTFVDVERALSSDRPPVSTLILELPHRELGGKLTPWPDLVQISDYCRQRSIRLHCDGARIFEATAGYSNRSLPDIAALFDSMYISCYKGLGGLSGALLLGSNEFCKRARVWLRRFGGNLYTQTPNAVSGWMGFKRQWLLVNDDIMSSPDDHSLLSFAEKTDKLRSVVASLSADEAIGRLVSFDPPIPETCMVHGYLHESVEACQQVLDDVEARCGIRVVRRVRPVPVDSLAFSNGYRSKFEFVMGELNGNIPNAVFLKGWTEFALQLSRTQQKSY